VPGSSRALVEGAGAPPREAALVAAVVIRWGRRLVSRTAVVAAWASSGVRSCEWHPDTKDDAGERTRNELPRAELPQNAHLPSASPASGVRGDTKHRAGDYSFPHHLHTFRTYPRRPTSRGRHRGVRTTCASRHCWHACPAQGLITPGRRPRGRKPNVMAQIASAASLHGLS
jgi:hypothetical protein